MERKKEDQLLFAGNEKHLFLERVSKKGHYHNYTTVILHKINEQLSS